MKLSQIIEKALVLYYGNYPKQQFLCNAVNDMLRAQMINRDQYLFAVHAIEDLMLGIHPKGQHYTMINTLHRAGYLSSGTIDRHINYIQQLYCWWVFDLKRKGL